MCLGFDNFSRDVLSIMSVQASWIILIWTFNPRKNNATTMVCDSHVFGFGEFEFQTYEKFTALRETPCRGVPHAYRAHLPTSQLGNSDTKFRWGWRRWRACNHIYIYICNTFIGGRMLLPVNQKQLYSVLHHCPLPVYMWLRTYRAVRARKT